MPFSHNIPLEINTRFKNYDPHSIASLYTLSLSLIVWQFERFFHPDCVCVATMFAPVGYPPQPVLVFKPQQGHHELVASGSLLSVDPGRVLCKRVVLSGHPLKIHKRSAVIRYMFFNRGVCVCVCVRVSL